MPPVRIAIEPAEVVPTVEQALLRWSAEPGVALLDSSCYHPRWGRFSVVAADPVDVLEVPAAAADRAVQLLTDRLGCWGRPAVPDGGGRLWSPYTVGWIGYIGYECGPPLERVHYWVPRGTALPALRFALYDTVVVFDHKLGCAHVVAADWPAELAVGRPPATLRIAVCQQWLHEAANLAVPAVPEPPRPLPARADWSVSQYCEAVEAALRHIEAGDIYQVNVTGGFKMESPEDPLTVYRRLRRVNPGTYGAYLSWAGGSRAVLSGSPELFLELRGGRATTRPIKGTRPRTGEPAVDADHCRALTSDGKEAAELNMIIDLLRNDLGRVCAPGSVRVDESAGLEAWATVFHRVATITGRLQADRGWADLLRAAYPGGSITGAPKIRAMQIIDELEARPRGVYCGSVGWIGLNGQMTLNIAIRTLSWLQGVVHIPAGGAIVADSTPMGEYAELLAKARGLFEAVGAAMPAGEPAVPEPSQEGEMSKL